MGHWLIKFNYFVQEGIARTSRMIIQERMHSNRGYKHFTKWDKKTQIATISSCGLGLKRFRRKEHRDAPLCPCHYVLTLMPLCPCPDALTLMPSPLCLALMLMSSPISPTLMRMSLPLCPYVHSLMSIPLCPCPYALTLIPLPLC